MTKIDFAVDTREMIRLKNEGKSYVDIGLIMGFSMSAVWKRLNRQKTKKLVKRKKIVKRERILPIDYYNHRLAQDFSNIEKAEKRAEYNRESSKEYQRNRRLKIKESNEKED